MSHQPRGRRTAAQWKALIEEQASSGLTQAAFCAAHEVGLSTFKYWKRRLKGGNHTAQQHAQDQPLFRPLNHATIEDTVPTQSARPADWTVELDLGNGMCLRLKTAS